MNVDAPLPRAGPVEDGPFDPLSTWIQHEYASEALRATTDLLEGATIPVLPVKGIVLARTLYDDVAERPLVDVDLRVRRSDFRRVVRALRGAGYELDWSSTHVGAVRFRRRGVLVELESSVGPPGACALTVDAMLSRARWHEEASGLRFREPEIHDHAVLLCLNVFKDFLRTRPWALEDLRRIVRARGFAEEAFVDRCRASRVVTAASVVAAFFVAEGDPCWTRIADALAASRPRRGYVAIYDWMRERPHSPKLEILVAHASADTRRGQISGIALCLYGMGAWKVRRLIQARASAPSSNRPAVDGR